MVRACRPSPFIFTQVISGGDHLGAVAPHHCCTGDTWYVELYEKDIEETLQTPVAANKVLCEVRCVLVSHYACVDVMYPGPIRLSALPQQSDTAPQPQQHL